MNSSILVKAALFALGLDASDRLIWTAGSKPDGAAPMSLALENTATYVLVNNTLPQSAFEGRVVDPYHGPYETA